MDEWILPILRGYIELFLIIVQKQLFEYCLISRRSRFMAGTRYKTRGVDYFGHVANYVETEELVTIQANKFSFVQIRGSVPLIWEQSGHKYKPIPKINADLNLNIQNFTKHFSTELSIYQRLVLVNLLDQKGVEQELGQTYEQYAQNLSKRENLSIFSFDFHEKCKSSYKNVTELIKILQVDLASIGIFQLDPWGQVVQKQNGVVRTNCLDCLDRTNLVQMFIGQNQIKKILSNFKIEWDDLILDNIYKESWANNGDAISLQYAGTRALKSDFTRTGKMQTKSFMKDGVKSLSRYYVNNFKDTLRQIAIELLCGIHEIQDTEDEIVEQRGLWNRAQYLAIEQCTSFLEQSDELSEDEVIINAWIIISINNANVKQERVVVLTNKLFFRFKYNFNDSKNPIIRYKKLFLFELENLTYGPLSNDVSRFGFYLNFKKKSNSASQSFHIYCPLNYSLEFTKKIVSSILSSVQQITSVTVSEKTIVRSSTVRSIVLNKLKMGMFNKPKKKSQSSNSANKKTNFRFEYLEESLQNETDSVKTIDDFDEQDEQEIEDHDDFEHDEQEDDDDDDNDELEDSDNSTSFFV